MHLAGKAGSRELRYASIVSQNPINWTAVYRSAAPLRYVERDGGMINSIVDDDETKKSTVNYIKAWGGSPFPPTLLAAFIAAQYARPPQFFPLLFPPILLFSTYLNIHNYKNEAAGISAAWSGIYLLRARRRRQSIGQKWGVRGVIRGATMGLCLTNLVSGGLVYAIGKTVKGDGAQEGNELV